MKPVCSGALLVSTIGRQFQPLANVGQHGHAELAAAVHDEVHHFRRGLLGRTDEIALVFAVFGVDHDDHFAAGNGVDGFGNGGKHVGTGVVHGSVVIYNVRSTYCKADRLTRVS